MEIVATRSGYDSLLRLVIIAY